MRWFSDEVRRGDDAAWDAALDADAAHLAAIGPTLPADLRALATDPRLHLHDARFVSVTADRRAGTIEMLLALSDGERALRLTFGDAAFVEDDLAAIAFAVGGSFATGPWGSTRTVILDQEVDASGDRWLLRLRLHPFHEFGIAFRAFWLAEEAAPPDDGRPGAFTFADD